LPAGRNIAVAPLLADSRVPDAAIQPAPPPPAAGLSGEDFAAVFKSRERARSAHFSLHWRASPAAASRFGMVVAKRLTRTAIRRNLIKRQARALFALAPQMPPRDVVLRLTANPRALARAEQYAELVGLFAALGMTQTRAQAHARVAPGGENPAPAREQA
jgi:ribonuclease P protein component